MKKYSIAGLTVQMNPKGETLKAQSAQYLTNTDKQADITVALSQEYLIKKQSENPHLSPDTCEYVFTGATFYDQLLDHMGLILHASAVVLDGVAYLFSAKSGTGKSTHTALWLEAFPDAYILNDDKPALRLTDGIFKASGTPWSGKTDQSINKTVPLKAIAFLSRGEVNSIRKLTTKESLPLLLEQTLRPSGKIDRLLELVDVLLRTVPVYSLTCDISHEAVYCSHGAMSISK